MFPTHIGQELRCDDTICSPWHTIKKIYFAESITTEVQNVLPTCNAIAWNKHTDLQAVTYIHLQQFFGKALYGMDFRKERFRGRQFFVPAQ